MSRSIESTGAGFAHRREVPEAWPELMLDAQELVDRPEGSVPPYLQFDAIADMHGIVGQLDTETLEVNRYYSLGVAMCYLARRLSDPDTYNGIVRKAASALRFRANQEGDPYKPGMAVDRIGRYRFEDNPWNDISHGAASDMLPAQRLLAESLQAASVIRVSSMEVDADEVLRKQSGGHSFTANSLAANIDAGISIVLRRALKLRAPDGAEDVTVGDCIDPEQLSTLQRSLHRPLIGGLARVRIDEIHALVLRDYHPIQDAEGVNDTGDWTFDRSYLDTAPAHNPAILHQARLECPAVQVPGLIRLVSQCVAEIVRVTDRNFAREYEERGGVPPPRYVDPLNYDYLN